MKTTLLAILLATQPALALAAETPKDEEEVKEKPETGTPAPAVEAAKQEAEVKPVVNPQGKAGFPRVTDTEETIYAVQRKAYLTNRKIEISPMFSASFADRFVQTFAPAVSVTYHIAENFGAEGYFSFMFPSESGLTSEILKEGKLTPEIAKLTQMRWVGGLGAQWSPVYGKIQVFGATLGNFGLYVGAGIGIGQTRVQCTPGLPLDPNVFGANFECEAVMATPGGSADDAFKVVYEPLRTQVMGQFGGGIRLYFSNNLGLKLEVRDWIFPTRVFRPGTTEPTQRFTDAIRNNLFINIGVSFLFGGEKN